MENRKWYFKDKSAQGLVISEDTGETIAVTYKAENAALVATAPELLAALEEIYAWTGHKATPWARRAQAAIEKAKSGTAK